MVRETRRRQYFPGTDPRLTLYEPKWNLIGKPPSESGVLNQRWLLPVWGYFWLSRMRLRECSWHPVGRGLGCYWTFYDVQHSPPQQRACLLEMSIVPRLSLVLWTLHVFTWECFFSRIGCVNRLFPDSWCITKGLHYKRSSRHRV